MPSFGPVGRRRFIDCFRQLGFTGPHPAPKHQFMAKGDVQVRVPNTDLGDRDLLSELLKQAGISRDEWERL